MLLDSDGKPLRYPQPHLPTSHSEAMELQLKAVTRAAGFILQEQPNRAEARIVRRILSADLRNKALNKWPYLFLAEWPMTGEQQRRGDLVWVDLDRNLLVLEVKGQRRPGARKKCLKQVQESSSLLWELFPKKKEEELRRAG